ncbi:MAG: L-serine ammonia-lyase [Thalassobius sp.]|nr:L-serine ammonia-lyase [Thalassovita sp.]
MTERISVFDMLKIGVGPSSSHTLGPWKAALRWLKELQIAGNFEAISRIRIELYGSLALTGKGHATDIAILMGLLGENPETTDTSLISDKVKSIRETGTINLLQQKEIPFKEKTDLKLIGKRRLPFHANGMKFFAITPDGELESTYFSIGGGFVVAEGEDVTSTQKVLPYPCDISANLLEHCKREQLSISAMVFANEKAWRTEEEINNGLMRIWHTMEECVYKGCNTDGILAGGLNVKRRAASLNKRLLGEQTYTNSAEWIKLIKKSKLDFDEVLKWVSCFALAVNEENAALGRVVTAPTNGSAGVIPAVIMYYFCFKNREATDKEIIQFLLVAGEIGTFFKKRATISAAMGGCQAEIGVSSAMAAAGLTEALGGSPDQCLMAAEIAMEHHLGLTCDPVGGLVQIPCIERNSMGAIKAITACNIALNSNPEDAKVTLDKVIDTMWQTAKDMKVKYKETSKGGLAVNITVNVSEC